MKPKLKKSTKDEHVGTNIKAGIRAGLSSRQALIEAVKVRDEARKEAAKRKKGGEVTWRS